MEVKFEKNQVWLKRHHIWNSLFPLCIHISLFLFCTSLIIILILTFPPFGKNLPIFSDFQHIDRKASEDQFVFGSHKLAVDVFNLLAESTNNSNVLISPVSMVISLSMLLESGWNTGVAGEIKKSLSWDRLSLEELHSHVKPLLTDGKLMKLDSTVFVDDTYELNPAYIDTLLRIYKTTTQKTDFQDKKASSKLVSDWLRKHHQQSVPLSTNDAAVLMNAVNFKARWKHPFEDASQTEFKNERGKVKAMTVMHLTEELYTNDLGGFKVLQLPYETEEISLFLILPDEGKSLHWLRTKLATDLRAFTIDLDKYLNKVKVDVCLPKLNLESSNSLRPSFSAAGLGGIFSESVPKTSDSALFVSDLFQGSRLVLDQRGTQASSVTVVRLSDRSSSDVQFCAVRPFIFFVRENTHKTLLFLGQFTGSNF